MAKAGLLKTLLGMAALAATVLTVAANHALAFQVAIAPMRFEVELGNRPVTRALKVINQSNEEMKVAIRVANFDLDSDNKVREIRPKANSLDQWIIIRPLKLTLKPGQTRTVRFAIRPHTRPRAGEHRAIIFIERDGAGKKQKGKLNVGFRFGVVVYAQVGKPVRTARLHGLKSGAGGLSLDVESTGTAHARLIGSYGIWPAAKFPGKVIAQASLAHSEFLKKRDHMPNGAVRAALLPDLPVLPGARRTIKARFAESLPPGSYEALISGRVGTRNISRLVSLNVGG